MKLKTIAGLDGYEFAGAISKATDNAEIAEAAYQRARNAKHNANYQIECPTVFISEAAADWDTVISLSDIRALVAAVEVMAAENGILLPRDWQVIY